MIDCHSHIVCGVDDGSENAEQSMKILKEAEKAGFDRIILTPHYMDDYYVVPKSEIAKKIDTLQQLCDNLKINIKLYQGNEIYISNNKYEFLKEGKASSLNNSRYVLFETPMNIEPQNLIEVIYKLKEMKKVPVLAHPERYSFIQKDSNKILEYAEMGVLFQSNYGSLIGQYGVNSKKTVKILLKNDIISFLGSDVHKEENIYKQINEIKNILYKIIGEKKTDELTNTNIEKILNDEKIEKEIPNKIKQSIFSKLF